jgi:2-polyprenyl-6-methoxyphenol hydroxylase-like FAD-dependent oxidoreductase
MTPTLRIIIVGGGIGGLATALALHAVGIAACVFEQSGELRELGVGINTLPHAIAVLAELGLLPALDEVGVRTRELIYANRFGQVVWQEARGMEAGHAVPQFSIHRGKLHGLLLRTVLARLGADAVRTGCRLTQVRDMADRVVATFSAPDGTSFTAEADALIGADGIHSTVRAGFYPQEGPPIWNGAMLWRGATEWPVYGDGRTMVIAGGMGAKFVFYPIHADPSRPTTRLTNWAVLARVAEGATPPRREDWSRPGRLDDIASLVRDQFRLDFVDPLALIAASGPFYEYPLCDRDPLPRWTQPGGRVTLLGDAAHPMYPVGSNGASQAILDAAALARHFRTMPNVTDALAAYDAERRDITSAVVLSNRAGGPERVIDVLEARAPDGFDDVEQMAPYAEREAIVRGYASVAGFQPQTPASEHQKEVRSVTIK